MVSEVSAQHCAELEFECNSTGNAFTSLISELKLGIPVYEDLINKAQKLNGAFRILLLASSAFLDSFQKIADLASSSNGATKELGAALTRICLKQRTIESRAKSYSGHLQDSLAAPLSERLEAWRRQTQQLEKERHRELKRLRSDAKRSAGGGGSIVYGAGGSSSSGSESSLRLGRRRRQSSGSQLMDSGQLERAVAESLRWQERQLTVERHWLRLARQESRSRLACFLACLKPGLDLLGGLADEFGHLRDLADRMSGLTNCCSDDGPEAAVAAASSALTASSNPAASSAAGGGQRRSFSPAPSVNSHGSTESDLYGAIGGCGSSASSSSTMRCGGAGSSGAVLLPGMPASTLRPRGGGGGCGASSSDSGFISQELRPSASTGDGRDDQEDNAADATVDYDEADAASATSSTSAASDTPLAVPPTPPAATASSSTGEPDQEPRLRHPHKLHQHHHQQQQHHHQQLYPDQSLPAPVYSNLGELQRNAARRRKFSFSSTNRATKGENPYAMPPPLPPPPPAPPPLPPAPTLSMAAASAPSFMPSAGTATLRRASVDFSSSAYLTAVAAAAAASAAAAATASSSSSAASASASSASGAAAGGAVPVPPPTVPSWQRQISEPPPPPPPHQQNRRYIQHHQLHQHHQQQQQPHQSLSFQRFVGSVGSSFSSFTKTSNRSASNSDNDFDGLTANSPPPPPPGF